MTERVTIEELRAAATAYYESGLDIVPLQLPEKKPLVQWKKWETERQTRQEFDNLPLARANGFGIICGKPNNEGLFLSVVDHDVKPPMTQEAIAKGKEILKDFPITQLEGTGNKGTHNVYYSRTKVQTVSLFHDDCALELLAENKLCIMAPSQGYVRLNDNTPTVLPDMEEKFYEILKTHGFTERKTKPTTITKPRLENNRIRFCCREALARDSHISHLMRLAIASEYKRAGYSNEDIVQLFKSQDDYDHDKCFVQVESADPLKAARSETIREYGYCYPECQENCIETKRTQNIIFPTPPQGGYSFSEADTKPMSLDDVEKVLDTTLKHDHENKLMVFLSMLMNYSGDDQQNILFNAPSSTGKSYIALEIAKLFPVEDVDKKGYTSPTAFFHVMGKLCRLTGEPLEDRNAYIESKLKEWEKKNSRPTASDYENKSAEAVKERHALSEWKALKKSEYHKHKEEWDGIEKIYVVSLEKRILIFKDQPHDRVLQVLRSMLSHDEKVLEVDITDKTKEGGHRTKKIRVIGFPTVVFCSASFSLNEQERTRFWILSPDMSQDKLQDSLKLQVQRLSDKEKFETELNVNEKRTLLMRRIQAIKASNVHQIIIPKELASSLLDWFTKGRALSARDQRDFPRLIDLVKAHALFQMFQRVKGQGSCSVIADQEDVETAKNLLDKVLAANRLGLPPYVHKFYFESLEPSIKGDGMDRETFSKLYFGQFKERLGEKARKLLIDLLKDAGLIEETPDPLDKRKMKIYLPLEGGENKKSFAKGTFQCLECKAKKKQSVFATDADLAAHMKAYHEAS